MGHVMFEVAQLHIEKNRVHLVHEVFGVQVDDMDFQWCFIGICTPRLEPKVLLLLPGYRWVP